MVNMTAGMRKNDFSRRFWLDMRNLMMKKQTIWSVLWYNTYIFNEKQEIYSAI